MTELEKLQAKPRDKRTPIEQCIVAATTFEEAEHEFQRPKAHVTR